MEAVYVIWNTLMVDSVCFLSLCGSFALCKFHFGDNKGGIGEEHKKETGHTRCYIFHCFFSPYYDTLFFFFVSLLSAIFGFCWPFGVTSVGFCSLNSLGSIFSSRPKVSCFRLLGYCDILA